MPQNIGLSACGTILLMSVVFLFSSYVMASYAHFLWDADEDEDEESQEKQEIQAAPNLVSEAASLHRFPPLAAPS